MKNSAQIDGYELIVENRKSDHAAGGIAIYVKKGTNHVIKPEIHKKSSFLEYLQIRLDTPLQLVVSAVYIPKTNEFVMRDFFETFFPPNERTNATVTLGDFNMHANKTKGQKIIADIERKHNLTQLIEDVTYESSGNILDHIYVSNTPKSFQVVDSGVIPATFLRVVNGTDIDTDPYNPKSK